MSTRRAVSSAIPDMSVADVRKQLDTLRRQWNESDDTFYLCNTLPADISIASFACKYVIGRQAKCKMRKRKQIKGS